MEATLARDDVRAMKRVAALYDIHGNLPALEAALEEIAREGVDGIVVGGDVVPGPMPREVMARLLALELPVRFLHGNGERDVAAFHGGVTPARVPWRFHAAMRWVGQELEEKHLEALASWPASVRLEIEGLGEVLFCHATPGDDNRIFTRLTPKERLRPFLDEADAPLVVCGHTHMQFDRQVGPVRVVNAGSVGMPFGEPGAYWALLGPEVELRRTEYDVGAAARAIQETSYPEAEGFDPAHPPSASAMLEAFEAAALR